MVQPDRLPIVNPLERHPSYVRSQHLLRDIGSDSCKHLFTLSRIARLHAW